MEEAPETSSAPSATGSTAEGERLVIRGSSERNPPPSGLRVAMVLGGIVLGLALFCVLFSVGYIWYLDVRGGK